MTARSVPGQSACPSGGVSLKSATGGDGKPHGLIVGYFVSISAEPALIGACPAKTSTTWWKIRDAGAFCVNVLAADYLDVRRLARSKLEAFDELICREASGAKPVLAGAQAWFQCTLDQTLEIGDHFLVVGRVDDCGGREGGEALIHHRRAYGTTEVKLTR